MELFLWDNDKFSVGNFMIDYDHQTLISIINRMTIALDFDNFSNNLLIEIVDDLFRYTVYHFKNEETLLKKYNYPEFDLHHRVHEVFVSTMEMWVEKIKAKQYTKEEIIDLNIFLKKWLSNHILKEDRAYSSYIVNSKRDVL